MKVLNVIFATNNSQEIRFETTHTKYFFPQDSRTRGLIFRGMSGMLGKLARDAVKSGSRIKKAVLAHEREGERKLNQAWEEIAQLKVEMEAKDKEKERISAERDQAWRKIAQLKGEMEAKDKEKERISAELKGEIVAKEKEKERRVSENGRLKERVNLVEKEIEKKKEIIGQLHSTNVGLTRAFDITAAVNRERDDLNAQVEKTDRWANQAKRSRDNFEDGPAQELKRVNLAVSCLVKGDFENGEKLIGDIEEQLAPEREKWSKSQKRKQRRTGNKPRREGGNDENQREGEEGDDSFLMIERGGRVETETEI